MNAFRPFGLILLTLFSFTAPAQQMAGVVSYNRVEYWTKIYSRATYLSREEKDRIQQTFKNDDGETTKMKLLFTPDQSLYTYESEQAQTDDGRYSWRHSDYIIQRNFKDEKKTEIEETLGKTYLIEDSLRAPNWKVMNQIKDIAGHICMKAVTEDTVRNQKITAWFAQDIPVPAGPERYFGLPGLILELDLNDGDVLITATKIDFKDVSKDVVLAKKPKGRKLTDAGYDKLIGDYIKDSIKGHRFPYIRY